LIFAHILVKVIYYFSNFFFLYTIFCYMEKISRNLSTDYEIIQ